MRKKNYVKPSMVQYELKTENFPIGYNGSEDSGTNLA